MKKLAIILVCLATLLAGCHKDETPTWRLLTDPSTEHTKLSADELCSAYAAVTANFWQMEAGQWQLTIIEAPKFAVAIYIADQTYEFSANTLDDLRTALSKYPCANRLDEILDAEPYVWYANTGVQNPDSNGWGMKKVLDYNLPWPALATDTGDSWWMDDASFQVSNISTKEDATADLEEMVEILESSDVNSATILYYEDGAYQALAFCVDGMWDISIARYDSKGSIYLCTVGQQDFEYIKELADHYSMRLGVEALEVSTPYYSK